MTDSSSGVLPFVIAAQRQAVLRGRLVRIDDVATSILGRHDYPDAIAELSAEALVLAVCLASMMDYDGVFTLQASGKASLKTLFADVTSDGAVRAYAHYHGDELKAPDAMGNPGPLLTLMGTGYLAFSVDQSKEGGKERGNEGRYQGIIPLEDPDLNAAAMRYFADSEQIDSALLISAKPDSRGGWHSAALMLQRIPEIGGSEADKPKSSQQDDDIWHTAMTLMATCTKDELTDPNLPPEDVLYRLFNELEVKVLGFSSVRDECRCSPERVNRMLDGLALEERQELADEDGLITVSCEFCKKQHRSAV